MSTAALQNQATSYAATTTAKGPSKALRISLWTIQSLLAALFMFAGVMKFVMPAEQMTQNSPLPLAFFYFIGAAEILGALGLVLPGIFRIRQGLTPLAAAGLTVIMVGAVTLTVPMGVSMAVMPFVTGLLTAFVAHRRWKLGA